MPNIEKMRNHPLKFWGSEKKMASFSDKAARISRLLSIAIGLLLIVSGVLKAADIVVFIKQMKAYQIFDHPLLLTVSAWGLIALECGLGAALVLSYRPRLVIPVTVFFWIILLFGTAWAWLTGVTEECGCYGAWSNHTPRQATIENLIFLCLTIIAWARFPRTKENHVGLKTCTVTAAFLIGAILPFTFGFPLSAMIRTSSKSAPAEIEPIEITGLDVDLISGNYLVVIMGTECPHCQEVLPEIESLAASDDLPQVIALTADDESRRQKFIEKFEPLFKIGQISEEQFWNLLGDGGIPRVLLLQNGRILKVWDRTIPQRDAIKLGASPLFEGWNNGRME